MQLYCVFLDQKVKIVISKWNQDGFSQNMAAISQHAVVEKIAGEGIVYPIVFPFFMFWLEVKAYGDAPHVFTIGVYGINN